MPTVLRHGPYRFFFYSNEAGEPMHVHVARDRDVAKFWLEPVRLQRSGRFQPGGNQPDIESGRGAPRGDH